MTQVTSGRLIVPGDDAMDELRKRLGNAIIVSKERKYKSLRDQGYDPEVAAQLSGVDEFSPIERASAILRDEAQASDRVEDVVRPIVDRAVTEVPYALRSVGSAAGSAIGNAAGAALISLAARNAATMIVGGTALLTVGGVVAAIKVVAPVLGKGAATVAGVASGISSALVVLAVLVKAKGGRR